MLLALKSVTLSAKLNFNVLLQVSILYVTTSFDRSYHGIII